ncbi:Uncharacterised protein r2_g3126 [Pycnogonum litorale]
MTLTFVICLYTITSSKETCVDTRCVCKHQTQFDVNGTKPVLKCQGNNISLISKTLGSSSDKISGIFGTIRIWDAFSKIVNPNLLATINVPIIMLYLPKVNKLDIRTFSGQENNIEILVIFENLLSKIPIAAIKNLEKLSELRIIDALNIEEIEEKCFHYLSPATIDSLSYFQLDNSSLRSIGSDAFSALTNLRVLRLTKCKLETFSSGVLPVQHLSLYITSKKFTDLQQNALDDLSPGSEISYYGNMISSTSLKAWNTIIQKRYVIRLYGIQDFY